MAQMLDCLVNYFGLDEDQEPGLRRYFSYHIVGGPGPAEGAGVAVVNTLAVYDANERCTYCEPFHAVETGGPAAAIAKAIRYLDAVHREKHVRKVQTEIRCLGELQPAGVTPPSRPGSARTTAHLAVCTERNTN